MTLQGEEILIVVHVSKRACDDPSSTLNISPELII